MSIGATSVNEYQLERFLFGAERVPLERVRGPIIELQEGRCFYCAERLASRAGQTPDVDHFIPWSRYPDDGLENLVVAHARCNAQKSDFLAAAAHVDHWRAGTRSGSPVSGELGRLAEATGWSRHPRADARRCAGALPPSAGGRAPLAAG